MPRKNFRFLDARGFDMIIVRFLKKARWKRAFGEYGKDYFEGSITSRPPMYLRSTSGMIREPSFCW